MAQQNFIKFVVVVALMQVAVCNPAKPSFWKGTQLDSTVEEMRSNCATGSNAIACMKFKVVNFLDTIFQKDNFKVVYCIIDPLISFLKFFHLSFRTAFR